MFVMMSFLWIFTEKDDYTFLKIPISELSSWRVDLLYEYILNHLLTVQYINLKYFRLRVLITRDLSNQRDKNLTKRIKS